MSLSGVFNSGLQGVNISSRGLSVTSNNIANVNTKGYARQIATIGGDGGASGQVTVSVSSIVSPFVELQLINSSSDFGTLDGRQQTVRQMESLLGAADQTGLGNMVNKFFASLGNLSSDPSSASLRQQVRQSALSLTDKFQNLNKQLNDMRRSLSSEISSRVETINSLSSSIADLNRAISQGTDTSVQQELSSKRLFLVRQLAEEVGVTYYTTDNNIMQVQLEDGSSIVNFYDSGSLSVSDNLSHGADIDVSIQLPQSSTTTEITSGILSGRLGGNLIDRNATLNDTVEDLDTLAYQIATQFNAIHADGYGLNSSTGNNFFVPLASSTNAAGLFNLDSAITSDLDNIAAASADPSSVGVGDNRNLLALIDLQTSDTMSSGTQTFSQFYDSIVGDIATTVNQISRDLDVQDNLRSQLELQRESISGVNLDEMGADLIRFQKAYQASVKVLLVADEVLQSLMEI